MYKKIHSVSPDPTVKYLYHGRSAETFDAVLQQGLSFNRAMDVNLAGKGIYLATLPSHALQYSTDSRVLVVRTILGDSNDISTKPYKYKVQKWPKHPCQSLVFNHDHKYKATATMSTADQKIEYVVHQDFQTLIVGWMDSNIYSTTLPQHAQQYADKDDGRILVVCTILGNSQKIRSPLYQQKWLRPGYHSFYKKHHDYVDPVTEEVRPKMEYVVSSRSSGIWELMLGFATMNVPLII